jgi:4-amino-4-deoxy-L-arabinose transferase-like glycosyltransferase
MKTKPIYLIITFFALAKFIFHFTTNDLWSFHRDKFLYLALGNHLDWGYWSNPPFVGFMSWLTQGIFGGSEAISVAELRLIPALFSVGLITLVCLMTKELVGKSWQQSLGKSILKED